MDNGIGKKIRLRREELNMSQEELASLMNYKSRSSINKIELGKTDVSQSRIAEFAKALKTTPASLMGWQTNTSDIDLSKVSNIMPLPYTEGRTVPLIGTIACGAPIMASENFEENIPIPDNVSADFCLRCKGDSMINARIYDGDIVFIRSQPMVENGEIAAVLIDEMVDLSEATLKRVYLYDSQIVLMAENSRYSPMAFSGEEMNSVRIIGKAVAFLGSVK